MPNMPFAPVAIVTRTRNRTVFLERAFESVLSQSFQNWHHVVVNDGGAPGPVDALAERFLDRYMGRLTVIHNPVSHGMEAASNLGIRQVDSRWIVIHDDDDSWAPNFLEATTGFLTDAGSRYRGVVTHSMKVVESLEPNGIVEESRTLLSPIENVTAAVIATTNLFPPISFLYERSALEQVGFFREDLPVLGDWEFNVRFLAQFDVGVLPQPLANWHHRPASRNAAESNSIFSGAAAHSAYRAQLRNQWLRQDLADGRIGLGILGGIGAEVEALLLTRDTILTEEIRRQIGGRDATIEALHRRIEEQIAENLMLQDQGRQRDAKIVALHAELERRIGEIQALSEQILGRDAAIQDIHGQLERQIAINLEQLRARDEETQSLHRQLEEQTVSRDEVIRTLHRQLEEQIAEGIRRNEEHQALAGKLSQISSIKGGIRHIMGRIGQRLRGRSPTSNG